jgi:glycosyltransferase involved in cell wall biosynthesis/tetratricopeptide (TPR) repeat protein
MNLQNRWRPAANADDFNIQVAEGDAARDLRDWARAEEAYRAALTANGAATPIWVQYGHALKEQGKLEQALDAYRTALRLNSADADTHLQLGHALKLSGDRGGAAQAYWQALKIDPSLTYAAIELKALGWRDEDLPSNSQMPSNPRAFEGENQLAQLLAALRASEASNHQLLVSNPVFTLSNQTRGEFTSSQGPPAEKAHILSGALKFDTRADHPVFNELDPDFVDSDLPLTRHMTHTWHRFELRREFHLNSIKSRLAFIVYYYRTLIFSIPPLPEKLITQLNSPAQAFGPITRFLFSVWQADFRDQSQFDIQQEQGYLNFLTEVVGRQSWSEYFPDELIPSVTLMALHQPAIYGAPLDLSKGQYSTWIRSGTYRSKYGEINNPSVRQAFIFDLILHDFGGNPRNRLISPDLIGFWSAPISPEYPGLSRFAAALAHVSRRLGDSLARSPAAIASNADAIAHWYLDEVISRFPQFAVFTTTPIRAWNAHCKFREPFAVRRELRKWGIDYVPGDSTEEIDVLVIGPIAAQSGLGTGARRSIGALSRTRCKFRTLNFAYDNPSAMTTGHDETAYHGENPRAVLWHYNAEYLQNCMQILDIFSRGRYNIGYFFWETEVMPKAHQLSLGMVDEIWTPSEFVAKCYSAAPVPIVNVGTSVELPNADTFFGRSYFGLGHEYVFMFSFDGHSVIHRKNPAAVVRAFLRAFPDRAERVRLILKSQNLLAARWGGINGRNEELLELCARDPRIQLIDRTMPLLEYYSLKHACDCYVSLHRSEGFGYGPAEAMAFGKPVIMTNYSGNVEFATPDNCLLVDVKLIHTLDWEYLYWVPEMMWAEPDLDQAAAHMRWVFEDRAFAAQLGQRAKETINRDFGPDAMARRYAKRLTELGLNRNSGEGGLRGI